MTLSAPNPLAERASGVLLHLSSLPGPHGVGDLGPGALRFVDWLAAAGQRWWQMLPVGPIGWGDSPYGSTSAFAGEELFLSLEALVREGLLGRGDLRAPAELARGPVDYDAARRFKRPRLEKAWRRFVESGRARRRDYGALAEGHAGWLDEYAELAPGDPSYHRFVQLEFARQWGSLRAHAAAREVRLMGDLPIFVVADSVDVRAHPELFRLDARGAPRVVTGVPPDLFSEDGQLWGHPHYAWRAHRRARFRWWMARFEHGLELFDALRIDHFIGFHRAWEVRAGAENARKGRWRRTPGRELLGRLRARHGELPLVAEDLGEVTSEVHRLRKAFRLPGMRVLQFGFGPGGGYHLPHRAPRRSVCYTGTHDNDTVAGWFAGLEREERERVLAYTGGGAQSVAWDLVRLAFTTRAGLAIAPMQDLLGLGGEARMNAPGTDSGNWRWRLPGRAASAKLARRLRRLAVATERAAPLPSR